MKRIPIKSITTACAIAMATSGSPVLAESGKKESSDLWSKASLTTTYTLNRHLNPFDIDTEVHKGVATLRGTVESQAERDLAEELALGVDGITKVNNQLKVDPNITPKSAKTNKDGSDRSFMRKVEDATLTSKVKSQLLWNSNTSGLDINVDTRNGIVTLNGKVDTDTEAQLAEQIARNTGDVLGVKNNLGISGKQVSTEDKIARKSREAGQQINDSWITTKVKAALMYNRNVDGSDIDVDTKNGVVRLRGKIDSDFEREQAVSIASGIKGVKNVKPDFGGS